MAAVVTFVKDPNAVLDYQFDWTAWLAEDETISTSTMTAQDGITVDSDDNDTTTATVWLSGGTAGQRYEVTNRIVTNQGRTNDKTARFVIEEQ